VLRGRSSVEVSPLRYLACSQNTGLKLLNGVHGDKACVCVGGGEQGGEH